MDAQETLVREGYFRKMSVKQRIDMFYNLMLQDECQDFPPATPPHYFNPKKSAALFVQSYILLQFKKAFDPAWPPVSICSDPHFSI